MAVQHRMTQCCCPSMHRAQPVRLLLCNQFLKFVQSEKSFFCKCVSAFMLIIWHSNAKQNCLECVCIFQHSAVHLLINYIDIPCGTINRCIR